MKKITALLLIIFMFISVVACDSGNKDDVGAEESTTVEEGFVNTYDGIFQVGFSRKDITPTEPVLLSTGTVLENAVDPIYATCIAVHDGEKTVLIYTVDVKNINNSEYKTIRKKISAATEVPVENIMISATHNHSTPTPGDAATSKDPANVRWALSVLYKNMIEAGKEAIADLTDAEIYTSTGKTTGMAFVRRYLLEDGTYKGIQSGSKSTARPVAYESEADDTVQVIRFVRENKKDVVIANWQAHVAHAIISHPNSISGDLVAFARNNAESLDDDILFALYIGASGNINLTAAVPGTQKYSNFAQVGRELGKVIVNSFENMERVNAGKITVSYKDCEVEYLKDSSVRVAKAKELRALDTESEQYAKLLDLYGFESKYEVSNLLWRNQAGDTETFHIGAISFGDLGFVSVPYEMFDTNGMEVKDGSPFKMTFVLTSAGGCFGYIPSALAVPHGCYEVYSTGFVYGTAEKMVGELLSLLNSHVK